MEKYSFPFPPGVRIRMMPAPSHPKSSQYCIDFKVPCGTPVCTARDGIVVHRESRFGKGYPIKRYMKRANVVIIKHTNGDKIAHAHPNQKVTRSGKPIYAHNWKAIKGEKTIYAHLQWRSVQVALGQRVRQGQIIALSGQTGFATYPHLHFGVYRNDKNMKVKFIK